MTFARHKLSWMLTLAGGLMWVTAGCNNAPQSGAAPQASAASNDADHDHDADEHDGHEHEGHEHDGDDHAAHDHDHSGWWCDEHGVPEEVCGQCNSKLAAEFQKDGDWCEEHDRPDSQCFVCHPDLQARFAAEYEAKYGKQPPKLEL